MQGDVTLDRVNRQELTQTIYEEAEHLNQLIRNVLDMTRLESGEVTIKREWQSFEEIVGAVLHRLSDAMAGRQIATHLPGDMPLLFVDALLIGQVLMNLSENALKYTPEGTPLDLSASVRGDEVLVELADGGAGIRPGDEERIFEKFVRGDGPGGGIGLGLAICRAIVDAHGGRIWAENRPGGGAVFRFTLPLGEQPPLPEPEEEEVFE
ncbi:MAG: ATP-binding protein [Comamonadaceae bacterium]|nr:ATP-binding protein [Comamonadaceae bacterium]